MFTLQKQQYEKEDSERSIYGRNSCNVKRGLRTAQAHGAAKATYAAGTRAIIYFGTW